MKEVVIDFDYDMGPIWKENFDLNTGKRSTGIGIIDNDEEVQRLNDEANRLFMALNSFENGTYRFDNERFKKIKPDLQSLTYRLIRRLDEINDGTYEIINKTTKTFEENAL